MLLLQLSRHPEYTAWISHALVLYSSQACWHGVTTQAKQVLHHPQARGEVPWQRIWKKSPFPIRITWALTIPVPLHYDSSDKEERPEKQHWLAHRVLQAWNRGEHSGDNIMNHTAQSMAFDTRLFLVIPLVFDKRLTLPLYNTITAEVLSGQWWLKGCEMIPGFIPVTGFSHGLLFRVMPHPVFLGTKFSSQADCWMKKGNPSPSITENQLFHFPSHLMSSHRGEVQRNLIQSRPFLGEILKI